jgi:phospholipase/carboxylesterase
MTAPLLDCVELTTGHGQPRHAVIWLHGLGADGHDFAGIVPELNLPDDLPVRFVFPHAPMIPVTINHGYLLRAWYDILHADGVERTVDQAGIHASRQQIEALIAREAARGVPAERLALVGFSQGGAMAYVTGLSHAQPLAGVAALSTYIPNLAELDALRQPANHATPVFAAHGEFDNVVPLALGQQAVAALRQRQQPISWRTYPMMHAVCEEEISELGRWLNTVLRAHPA